MYTTYISIDKFKQLYVYVYIYISYNSQQTFT